MSAAWDQAVARNQEKLQQQEARATAAERAAAAAEQERNRYKLELEKHERAKAELRQIQDQEVRPLAQPAGMRGPSPAAKPPGVDAQARSSSAPPKPGPPLPPPAAAPAPAPTTSAAAEPPPQTQVARPLRVKPAPPAQPSRSGSDDGCYICTEPKIGDCTDCTYPCCKEHFDAGTRRCPKCANKKSLPDAAAAWDEQWKKTARIPIYWHNNRNFLNKFVLKRLPCRE